MQAESPQRTVDKAELTLAALVVAVAALCLFVLVPYGVDSPGSIDVMALGPAFWPSVVSGFMLVMGLVIGVRALRVPSTAETDDGAAGTFAGLRFSAAISLLALYYLALDGLGMVLSSAIALVLFVLLGGERRVPLIAMIAIGLPLALFAFFRYAANVVIPLGPLDGLLG